MSPQDNPIALQAIVLVIMLFGAVSVPILPGLVIIWVAALVYGLVTGLSWVSGAILAVMALLMIGGSLIDNVIMGAAAKQKGASWWALGAALLGGIIGSLIFPPFGGLLLALLALFAVEFTRLRDWQKALDSTKSMALGCGWATIIRFGIGLLMIGMWLIWAMALK